MTVYISLLRGINVSGQRKIKMTELKALYETLGLSHVQTYIQSGNVVFDSRKASASSLEASIIRGIDSQFGFAVDVLIRTVDEWRRIIEHNPFSSDGEKDIKHLHVTLLAEPPDKQRLLNLTAIETGADEYHLDQQVVFLYCPNGYGRTRLTNTFWEQKLKVTATTRNWRTVNQLLDMAQANENAPD